MRSRPHKAQSDSAESSVETLATALLPLASLMLRGKFSASLLIRAAKLAYLRASTSDLELAGIRPSISRLSVITGMTRKEVAALLKEDLPQPEAARKRPLEHRAVRVLRGWTADPLYKTALGRPAELVVTGEGRDFSSLVKAYAGDVTPMSVLRELERMKAVTRTRKGGLRPSNPKLHGDLGSHSKLKEFSRLLEGFSRTAVRSLSERDAPLYIGFRELQLNSKEQAENFKRSFARRAALLLDGVAHWNARQATQAGSRQPRKGAASGQQVGLGVYLVHKEPACRPDKDGRKPRS